LPSNPLTRAIHTRLLLLLLLQVPGWQWWPARVLPGPPPPAAAGAEAQQEDGAAEGASSKERVVLFLVDNTVARVPASLPQFNEHYQRFLAACYPNKVGWVAL
jgi:hypothetical protein